MHAKDALAFFDFEKKDEKKNKKQKKLYLKKAVWCRNNVANLFKNDFVVLLAEAYGHTDVLLHLNAGHFNCKVRCYFELPENKSTRKNYE